MRTKLAGELLAGFEPSIWTFLVSHILWGSCLVGEARCVTPLVLDMRAAYSLFMDSRNWYARGSAGTPQLCFCVVLHVTSCQLSLTVICYNVRVQQKHFSSAARYNRMKPSCVIALCCTQKSSVASTRLPVMYNSSVQLLCYCRKGEPGSIKQRKRENYDMWL